jgi:hypothetical protein
MNISEKILDSINTLPESRQIEVFDFIEYLNQKTEKEEYNSWSNLSIISAMRGMEDEESIYTIDDLKEVY